MPDRRFTWEAIIDTRTAIRSINELADAMKRTLNSSGANKVEIIDRASLETAKQQARAAASEVIESQRRMTVETRTQGQERSAAAKAEANVISEAAKSAAQTRIEQERRSTSLLKAELAEQSRAFRESQKTSSSGGSGLQNAVLGGIAGYFTVQGARQIFNYAQQIATLDTNVSRATKAFKIMAGSAGEAEKRLRSIVSASGGTVNNLQAIEIANQATALGLAKTSKEFENLTRAARAVTFVSPVIHDVQSAITELALASANLSYRRLDQLGLSVTEVRNRVNDLMAANSGLDESQAFLSASVDALNSKFGTLLDSTEAQASGVETLNAAWSNFVQKIATSNLGDVINSQFSEAALLVNKFSALLTGDKSGLGTSSNLENLIAGKKSQLLGVGDGGSAFQTQIADLERLKSLVDEANRLAGEGNPGLDEYIKRLQAISDQAVYTGSVTREMGMEMSVLQALISNAANALDEGSKAGNYYADAVARIGADAIAADGKMSSIVERMVTLTAEYNTGQVSASEYGAAINTLGGQLVGLAGQAALAAIELANVNYQTQTFYGAANSKLFFGSGGTQGSRPVGPVTFQQAQSLATDTSINPFTLESQSKNRKSYLDGLAKEQEKADREAAAAAKRAATAGAKLYNQANDELKSTLTAIIKVSDVTQEDIDAAKNGTYKEKPDEYLRQLRDEVKNGKDYAGIGIEEAAAGLNKIGIETAGKSAEAILSLFEQAFSDLSLFADKDNLKFLNDEAVQQQLQLKELAKQGQQNVFEHYGVVVGQAVQAAIGSGSGVATESATGATAAAATINIDGQGVTGQGVEVSATITKFIVADTAKSEFTETLNLQPKLTFSSKSVVFTADDAALVVARLESQIQPKLTFNSNSIVFTADDAQLARDRLSDQLTPTLDLGEPEKGFYLGADAAEKIKQNLADSITPSLSVLLDASQQEQELLATKISQNVMPVIKPILGDPDMVEVTALQQRITSLLNSEEAASPTIASGGLGGVLNSNAQKTKANPLATRYVSDLVASFSDTEVTLPLLGVGAFVLGVINSGFDLAKTTSTIGTDIIANINEQMWSEQNIALQKSIGNNIYQLIIGGIRIAMKAKNNNIGQEIVDNIAAQVIESTVGAVEGATQ